MLNKTYPRQGLDLDRVLLNLTGSKHPDDALTLRDLFEHVFVTGSTGSGKTSTIGYHLAQSLLSTRKLPEEDRIGMIVLLYKSGDLQQWIDWAEQQGRERDLMIINPDDKNVFNLLEAYRDKEAISAVDTLMIVSGLSLNGSSQQNSEQYWEQMNRQRLHRLVLLNQLCGEALSLHTLHRLHSSAPQYSEQVDSEDFKARSYCWQMLGRANERCGENHPQFKLVEDYFVREFPYMADRTQSSILSLTSGILEPFVSSPMLSGLFAGGTKLDLDEMLRGKIVLLNLPIQQYEYAGKLAQILFKHLLQKRIEGRDLENIPNPVCFYIDEYQYFISPYDALFLSTARSARAGCVLMTQNISNLYAQVGGSGRAADEKVNALLALTNHKLFLAQNNSVTNEFASKTIGMGIHRLSNTSVQVQQFAGNAGQSESYHYQVMPHEFTMLKRGGKHSEGIVECIVTATGKRFSNGKNYLRLQFLQPWHG